MDIDRIVTNIANGHLIRAQGRVQRADGMPSKVLEQYKQSVERGIISSIADEFHNSHPDIFQWSAARYGEQVGTVSVVMMDEHEFRVRMREALMLIMGELHPELSVVAPYIDKSAQSTIIDTEI